MYINSLKNILIDKDSEIYSISKNNRIVFTDHVKKRIQERLNIYNKKREIINILNNGRVSYLNNDKIKIKHNRCTFISKVDKKNITLITFFIDF